MTWFGREPVTILAFIAVALKLSTAYGWDLTAEQQTYIMAALSAVVALVEAVVLKSGAVFATLVNLGHACLALFLGFGMEMAPETQALWVVGIEAFVAILVRREVTAPVALTPIEQSSPMSPRAPVVKA